MNEKYLNKKIGIPFAAIIIIIIISVSMVNTDEKEETGLDTTEPEISPYINSIEDERILISSGYTSLTDTDNGIEMDPNSPEDAIISTIGKELNENYSLEFKFSFTKLNEDLAKRGWYKILSVFVPDAEFSITYNWEQKTLVIHNCNWVDANIKYFEVGDTLDIKLNFDFINRELSILKCDLVRAATGYQSIILSTRDFQSIYGEEVSPDNADIQLYNFQTLSAADYKPMLSNIKF